MSRATNVLNIAVFAVIVLLILGQANAKLLANVSTDKEILANDEIGAITIDLFNDTEFEQKDVMLRIESTAGVVFPENEDKQIIVKQIDSIKGLAGKELKIKIKGASSKALTSNIFVYYGAELDSNQPKYASGTFVTIAAAKVAVTSSIQKITQNGEQMVEISFKMTNNTGADLNVMAEMIAPVGFEVKTGPAIFGPIQDRNSYSGKIDALVPLNVTGDQTITLAYGYTDANGGHYFEKNSIVNFQKSNSLYLGIVGIIVLAIAIYIYVRKTKGDQNLKGTGDKKK